MSQSVRAIYEKGQLRLLEQVNLREGEVIEVTFVSEDERVRAALGDLLVPRRQLDDELDNIDEEALLAEVREGFKDVSLSDIIIEERREGP